MLRWMFDSFFYTMSVDEWGLMTLRNKVEELGYNLKENTMLWFNRLDGLLELKCDSEIWNLLIEVKLCIGIEVWIESIDYKGEKLNCSEFDEVEDELEDNDYEWEYKDEFDYLNSDEVADELDDIDFDTNVDLNVEFVGVNEFDSSKEELKQTM